MQTFLICGKFVESSLCCLTAKQKRAFNINGELLVENMRELSFIRQRIVFDHFSACKNDLHGYQVDKNCCLAVKGDA